MDYNELIGKVIADRNSKKLGICLDIRKSIRTGKSGDEPYILMLLKIEQAFRDSIKIEVEVGKIIKIDGKYAWIDTTKKEFFESLKNAKKVKQTKKNDINIDLSILKNYKPHPPSTKSLSDYLTIKKKIQGKLYIIPFEISKEFSCNV